MKVTLCQLYLNFKREKDCWKTDNPVSTCSIHIKSCLWQQSEEGLARSLKKTHIKILFKTAFYFFKDFIWERKSMSRGRDRRRSRLPAEHGPPCGAWSHDPDILTWAQGRCLTDWITQVPLHLFFFGRSKGQ